MEIFQIKCKICVKSLPFYSELEDYYFSWLLNLFSLFHNKTSKSKILINNSPGDMLSDLNHNRLSLCNQWLNGF